MITVIGLICLCVFILVAISWPLGWCVAQALEAPDTMKVLAPFRWIERCFSGVIGPTYKTEMNWKEYAFALISFHCCGIILLFALVRWQVIWKSIDPLAENMAPLMAFNVAISYVTNTNWQAFIPELQLSWPVQMIAVATQQFLSASVGMALFCALARAFRRNETNKIGNFWQDLVRSSVYVFLPLALITSILLVISGVPQTVSGTISYTTLEGETVGVPIGMNASSVAIKLLGENGGGLYAVNGAHPLENPTPFSNLIELLAILILPMALCRTFGEMVQTRRQGVLFLAVMTTMFIGAAIAACWFEGQSVLDMNFSFFQSDGNMEGKECRLGPFWSVFWSVATTATSNGSVNCSLSSLLPATGGVCLALMQIGEVVFGGIGTGMITAIVFLLIAVFAAGLMVGRTPEYLGKKIESQEMKFVALLGILPAAIILVATSVLLTTQDGLASLSVKSPHGISEALYAASSTTLNNGSSFAGVLASSPSYLFVTSLTMYFGRLLTALLILALAGTLVEKKRVAETSGTLDTDSVAFGVWFGFVILMFGALNFLPALTLGPVIEHMTLYTNKVKNWNFVNAEGHKSDLIKTSPLLEIGAVFIESERWTSAKTKTDSSPCLCIFVGGD